MYSGTTLPVLSGRVIGAHQKINRLARASIRPYLRHIGDFPSSRQILHFEGVNGPDALKRKSPAKDEPWHFFAPFDDDDLQLIHHIEQHYGQLVRALQAADEVRAAFEAAWVAHAVVDGLTPAHHYPYEEKILELSGKGLEARTTMRKRLIMKGDTRRKSVHNNWKMWGPGGLMTTHSFFEWGVAALLVPVSTQRVALSKDAINEVHDLGPIALFKRRAREIAGLNMFETYASYGWTPALARQTRQTLIPNVVQTVALIWYSAACEAGLTDGSLKH